MRDLIGICFLMALSAMLSGCHSEPKAPTVEDAKTVWQHVAAQTRTDRLVALESLTKTDGQMQKVNGVNVYTFSYETKVRYLTSVGKWKTGDVQTVDSNYGFQQTEKGWQGPDGTVYAQ